MKVSSNLTETKEVAQDLTGSALEVGTSIVLENLPELGTELSGIITNETAGVMIQSLAGGFLGAVAPAFLGIKLAYQQKRFERNMMKMVTSIKLKQDLIDQRLEMLNPEVRQKFINGSYRDVLLDNIISENQEQKVQNNINGYINLMGVLNPNDDVVFTFFQTLSQMNELDIRILRLYRPTFGRNEERQENYMDVMRDENIDQSQYNFIREKLCRLGMLDSENEKRRDENLDVIGETVKELVKQLQSKSTKAVKSPAIKHIFRGDSYHITNLGKQYLAFIEDPK